MGSPASILADLDKWDAATSSERLTALNGLIAHLSGGFTFNTLTRHALGGQSHEIGTFIFEDAEFALLPGRSVAILGYDRSKPFAPDATQAADWAATEQEFGVTLVEYLDHYMSPLRRVSVAPFLIEVRSTSFDYGQSGKDQADGYQEVIELCPPGFRLPTCDEWEYACAAGTRSLFRWGNEAPNSDSYREKAWDLHKRPNAFGLLMNSSTYDNEICQGPKFRGGDGGQSVCGDMGNLATWLPFSSSFQVSDDEVDDWWIDFVHVRRVCPIGL